MKNEYDSVLEQLKQKDDKIQEISKDIQALVREEVFITCRISLLFSSWR